MTPGRWHSNFFLFGEVTMKCAYLGYFSISFEKITFYTEILTRKVELWIVSLVSDLFCLIEPAKMAENFFGGFIFV